jgi:transcriptional regulator with XRE-family HTH domain
MPDGETTSFFSQVIRDVRSARGLTQDEFAKVCGVTQPAVVKWERGRPLAEATLGRIAERLGLTLAALLYPNVAKGYREFEKRRKKRKERGHANRSS